MESIPEPPLPSSTHYYAPLPHQHEKACVALPFHHRRRGRWYPVAVIGIILSLVALVYVFWPSDPSLRIVGLQLHKIHVHTLPFISIDISMNVIVKVRNMDVYSMDLKMLDVAVTYRGKKLGHVKSHHGYVRPLASSYVSAQLEFSGVRILHDVVSLLEDLLKGTVPFDTVTKVRGQLGFLVFWFPLKARLSCEILVNTNYQTIVRQNCYSTQSLAKREPGERSNALQ